MRILLKYLLRNIREKKLRSFLVFISLALTSGLFLTSLAITDTITGINLEMHRSSVGKADIRIFPKYSEDGNAYINMSSVNNVVAPMDYEIGVLDGNALYAPSKEQMIYAMVTGTTLEDMKVHNPIAFEKVSMEHPFTGNQLIISSITANKYNLSLGDSMELEFGNHKEQFQIYGVSELKGIFLFEGAMTNILIPKDTLAKIYGLEEEVNNIYLKLKDKSLTNDVIQQLQKEYPNCEVTEALNSSDLKQSLQEIQMPLKLVTIFIILMCVFIVFTSFRIISIERLPQIGTFRSVGATKKMSAQILKLESLLYGISGGIAGMGVGVVALWFITKVMAADVSQNKSLVPDFSPIYLLYTIIFAMLLAYLGAMLPILGIFKIPTKNLILNLPIKEKQQHITSTLIALLLLTVSCIVPWFLPDEFLPVLIGDDICITLILVALIMLLPSIMRLMVPLLEKLFSLGGRDNVLAAKNLKHNKSIQNIAGLLTIGISTLIIISSINQSIIDGILNLFSNTIRYDIQMVYRNADHDFIDELRAMDGITDATGSILISNLSVGQYNETIRATYGIDPEHYLNHWNFDIPMDTMMKLNEGRSIILGTSILEKQGYQIGDNIILNFKDGSQVYKIVGSFKTMWGSGNLSFISEENMRKDSGNDFYTNVYIKTNQPSEVIQKELQAKYLRDLVYNRTRSETKQANTEGVDRVFKILKSYTQLTMLIGIIGIINNLMVSFMERKRSFAVLRSVGMSKFQLRKMLFLEAFSGGIIGGGIGLLASALMLMIMPRILKQMMGPIDMIYSLPLFLGYLGVSILIMITASIIPAMKSSKLSIIETIKYE